jgi:uncharacterized tellurite resistance protein B-like protein
LLDSIKRFLEGRVVAPAREAAPQAREHALRLAAAGLLMEVSRADSKITDQERTVMHAALQSTFALSSAEADELLAVAERQSREAASLYEMTHLVDEALDPEQKKRIVELLWLVSFADSQKHELEEHMIRRIAGLLHVPHPDFIDAKIRARDGTP